MTFAPLETERLLLRRLEPGDAEAIAALVADGDVARYSGQIPHPFAPLTAAQWIDTTRADMAAGDGFVLACLRRCDGALIGCASLEIEPGANVAELAYWFGRAFWGRGYATEAARRLVGFAFATLGVARLWAAADVENAASARVLQKAGLRFDRTGPLAIPVRRTVARVHFYELRRADWRRRPCWPGEPVVYVSAVALIDRDDRVLVAQRPAGKAMAGLWEFPGGKVEPGERPRLAAVRELAEELGLEVPVAALIPFAIASHRYPDFHLLMPLYFTRSWAGTPEPREHQAIAWAPVARLGERAMPPADAPLVGELQRLLIV